MWPVKQPLASSYQPASPAVAAAPEAVAMAEAAVCGITLSALLGLLIVALRKGRGFS